MKKRKHILTTIFLLIHLVFFAQCIERKKISYGGDYGFVDFIHLCPTYNFAFGGDTSKNWNVLTAPIDISQAPKEVLLFKDDIEKKIIEYSGNDFFEKIKFNSVEVVYKNKLKEFKKSGRQDVTLKYCKAKYFYYYEFKIDSLSSYHIGIALNDKGKIISKFSFPSKDNYVPVDSSFNYCKLIQIAKKSQPLIEPIKDIKLDYDEELKRFYWQITQEIVNIKEGKNNFNQVIIDASDLNKTKNIIGETYINF